MSVDKIFNWYLPAILMLVILYQIFIIIPNEIKEVAEVYDGDKNNCEISGGVWLGHKNLCVPTSELISIDSF